MSRLLALSRLFRSRPTTRKPVSRKLGFDTLEDRVVPSADYVNALFHHYLGRDPGDDGLAYWGGQLDAGTPRAEVARQIIHSGEANGLELHRVYPHLLGRPADDSASWAWHAMQAGASSKDIQALIAASDEAFARAGGSNEAWLGQLYQNFLGRPLDEAGKAHWLAVMADGATRFDVAVALRHSPEAKTASVIDAYAQILDYLPDQGAREYWTQQMLEGLTAEDLEALIAGSDAAAAELAEDGDFEGFSPLTPFPGISPVVASGPVVGRLVNDFYDLPLDDRFTTSDEFSEIFVAADRLNAAELAAQVVEQVNDASTDLSTGVNAWNLLVGLKNFNPYAWYSAWFSQAGTTIQSWIQDWYVSELTDRIRNIESEFGPEVWSSNTTQSPTSTFTFTWPTTTTTSQPTSTTAARTQTVYFAVVDADDDAFPYHHVFPNSGYAPGYRTQQEAVQAGESDVRSLRYLGYDNPRYRIVSVAWPLDRYGELDSNYSVRL